MFFILYRSKISVLFDVLTKKIADATRLKAGQLEFETSQEIKDVVQRAGDAAGDGIQKGEIPKSQIQAAREVSKKLQDSPLSDWRATNVVQDQLFSLIKDYERIREDMGAGPARTKRMNEVAAKMRTLSLAAQPLLRSLTSGQTAGERLAAICILQVAPETGFFSWLIERLKSENQAFMLFQASVAVLNLVKAQKYLNGANVRKEIAGALEHVKNFEGGTPDPNTIDVLNESLSLVR
ncbi:MAG: hypothetical protein WBQ94_29730 [Terracidiphilus sp.]